MPLCQPLGVLLLPAHMRPPPPSLQESLLTQVQRIVKGEVSQAMKEQQAVVTSSIMQAMRSAASTPVPTAHLDYQTQQGNILQLLQQGQLNQAFQQVAPKTTLIYIDTPVKHDDCTYMDACIHTF